MARAKFQTNQLTPDEIAVVQSLESLANSATNERLQKVAGVIVNTATGDVVGPATSTDNTVPRWNGTDNKILQASTVSISDGGVLTLGANGVTGFDAVSYQQLQDALAGLKAKQSVVCATTADGTFATDFDNGSTVDGVTLTTGDRILIKNQTAQEENGIYIVAASGAPSRSSDADTWDELVSAYVYVEEGTTNADKGFICTINSGGTLGTDPVTWTGFSSSGGGITSLNALTDASQTFATGTTGTDFGISSAAGVHTFNIPDASGSARGVITTGAQTIAGAKTFSNAPVFSSVTASQILKVDAGKALTSGLIALGSEVSGTLPIANGGTNSTTALNNNRFIVSSGGAIVEHGAITASRALTSDANGLPAASATTATELGYLSGVTSAVQTQLGAKVPYTGATSNVDLGANSLTTSDVLTTDVQAQGSSGVIIKNSGGTAQAEFGSGGGTNATINGTTNIGTASADYHQIAGGTGTITDTATGSSTDININLVPKGTGRVQAGGVVVPTISSTDTLTNKSISGSSNTITNVSLSTGVTGTLPVANGGTGQTSYTDGQLLIGNTTGNTLTKATLTAGTGVTITNGSGSITIAASGGGGGGGDATSFDVAQTGHGFVVGDVIRATSTANTYAKAQADSAANAEVVGYVSVVDDANNFTYTTEGIVSAGVPTNTAGTVYFLSPSSAGALTATEPTTAGQISKPLLTILESATTAYFHNYRGMLLTDPTSAGTVDNGVVEGRLTLTTGTPVMTSTVTAATTVYFTPYKGNYIALYDGSADWDVVQFTEISLSLSGYTANKNYDIWCYNNGGTATLESTVWTDNTTRATALAKQDGVYVKSGATTRRYLGTIRINSSGGQCDFELGGLAVGGAIQSLYVWNYYNRVPVTTYTGDTTDYWIYTGGWRSANNSATYRLDLIVGVQEDIITASYNCYIYTSGTANVGVGYDTTLAFSGSPSGMYAGQYAFAEYRTQPTAGYHYVQAVEAGFSGTSYFYGDDGAPTSNQSILRLSHLC